MSILTHSTVLPAARATADPLSERFGAALPRELRAESQGLSWPEFLERYCPDHGDIALASWSCWAATTGAYVYESLIDIAGTRHAFHSDAAGPIAALTGMLHTAGRAIEILSFHQRPTQGGVATFVRCEHDGRRHWAIAISDSGTDSALRAVIAAANILTS